MKGGGHARHARLVVWFALLCVFVPRAVGQLEQERRWSYTVTPVRNAYISSSPAIGPGGAIYVGVAEDTRPAAGRLMALTPDGAPKWSGALRDGFVTSDWIDSSPAVDGDGTVYFGCWNGIFYALDGNTGAKKWEYRIDTAKIVAPGSLPPVGFIESSPAIGTDGTIYFGSSDAVHRELSALHALRRDGTERWRFPVGDWVSAAPAIGVDGTIYFVSWDGYLYAVSPAGVQRWRQFIERGLYAAPAVGPDGTIYVGAISRGVLAFSPAGTLRWTYPTGTIGGGLSLAADGTIYAGAFDATFYAIRPPDAEHPQPWTKWTFDADRTISSVAAVRADGTIIFGVDRDDLGRGGVVALDPDTGQQRWFYLVNESVRASPVIDASGRIYVGAYDRQVHAIQGNSSGLSQMSSWPMFHHDATHTGRVAGGARLINIATRADAGDANLIAGFTVGGSGVKSLLVRGIGPTLEERFNVPGALADPFVRLRTQAGFLLFGNDNWQEQDDVTLVEEAMRRVGAFALPAGSRDAAFTIGVPVGLYTASVDRASGAPGQALVEIYDADVAPGGASLINLSTLGRIGAAGRLIIPGFVVGGSGQARVLIRAVGPGLTRFQVPDVLPRPTMSVFAGTTLLRSNTGWTAGGAKADLLSAAQVTGAFPLEENSADCALLLTLSPGDHTVQVTGLGGGTGHVLVEIYLLP